MFEFLEALIRDTAKKIFLILDNARPPFKAREGLACRAPELNLDERLNADMKHTIGAKAPVRTKSKLKAAAEQHMTTIGKSRARPRLLPGPPVKYAA